MGIEIYPKVVGPPTMPHGPAALPAGSGLEKWIIVRTDTDGVVVNAETLSSRANGNGKLPQGLIDISHVPIFGIYMQPTFGSGPLTEVSVTPAFSDVPGNLIGYDVAGAVAAGIVTLSKKLYRLSAQIPVFFPVQNPGANFVGFYFSSTGIPTGSNVYCAVGLGWGSGAQLVGL